MSTSDSPLTSTHVTTIDAEIDAASDALLAIDPISRLATPLSALGLDDRAVWATPSDASCTDERPELGFSLLWRFGPPGQTARINWRLRLNENGAGRTLLTITTQAQASNSEAHARLAAGWPILETITLQHAKHLHHAIDDYTADPWQADRPARRVLLPVAA
jgi:hypothetical protein